MANCTKKPYLIILHYLANSLEELDRDKTISADHYLKCAEWEIIHKEFFHGEIGMKMISHIRTAKSYLTADREVSLAHLKLVYELIGKEVFSAS